jgi:DNA-binding response OmpR family regulator
MKEIIKVLLVDDDTVISSLLKDFLELRGYQVTVAPDGKEGIEAFKNQLYDICIIDVMMPVKDGFTLSEEIRTEDPQVPILFISSNDVSHNKIKALRMGADDYVTKPLDPEEVMLRLEAILRRQEAEPKRAVITDKNNQIQIGKFVLDFGYQRLINGKEVRKLTTREAELLRFLYQHRNSQIKRKLILAEVWGNDDYYKGRSLDVFMSRLRKYLKDDPTVEIVNIHGVGFKFLVGEPGEGK